MEFHLVTGYGASNTSFNNNEDPLLPGQGVLQGSSSAAPIYNFNTDVSLSTYQKLATGSVFTHPISGVEILDHATQYVDDKTEMINVKGISGCACQHSKGQQRAMLFEAANKNTNIWAEILWISGGNLNPEKCFYYYLHPKYNHATGRIQYETSPKAPGEILLHNPDTQITTPLRRVEPNDGRRTLGVILAPDGNCSHQIQKCRELAATYIGKIKHSKLSKQAKWTAVTTILEPAVLYPLMAVNSAKKDLEKIDKILTTFKCSALGLNEHFPRVVLHGPMALGGMSLPNTIKKTTSTRLTYFFYHTRLNTQIGKKLDASITFLQYEAGLFDQFLTLPFSQYGHLCTTTLIKTIWGETEPSNIQLRAADGIAWTPAPQGSGDKAIMEIATINLKKKESSMINRVRLYLQLFSIYDMITYDGESIHPEILRGERIIGRHSTTFWVDFPKPPKRYMKLWKDFLTNYITPMLHTINIQWYRDAKPNYSTTFYVSTIDNRLYQAITEGYLVYDPKGSRQTVPAGKYGKHARYSYPDPNILSSLRAVDVAHDPKHITIICSSAINTHNNVASQSNTNTLQELYDELPRALKKIVGKIQLPPDNGNQLIQYLTETNSPLISAADASLKQGNCSHSWIITTNNSDHIDDPYMSITGAGPVDGYSKYMSSTRGELQGQTAAAIAVQCLLKQHPDATPQVHFYGDNQGVQSKCSTYTPRKLRTHRDPNSDLLLEYNAASRNMSKQMHWVASHQDEGIQWTTSEELKMMKLSHESKLNIWCDKMAGEARQLDQSYPDAEVLPSEKWALYSCVPTFHKLTCHLDDAIATNLYYSDMLHFITKKHGMTEAKLNETMTECLERYLKKQRPHARASTVKLIHKWLPTNEFLYKQGRMQNPLCHRCTQTHETAAHIYSCPDPSSRKERQTLLYKKLKDLVNSGMPRMVATMLEEKLTTLFDIESMQEYCHASNNCNMNESIRKATLHQNLIGWDNFIRGFVSKYWKDIEHIQMENNKLWDTKLTGAMLQLHKEIWEGRNTVVHGRTIEEARKKARESVTNKVKDIYRRPPTLAARYPSIFEVPLENRLKRTTEQLNEWLHRIEHQRRVSEVIHSTLPPGQMTLQVAYARKGYSTQRKREFPP
jgi:hypothetical protein